MMDGRKKLTEARFAAIAAAVFWLGSLFFTGLISYQGNEITGFTILRRGWLATLVFEFGWYANAFFLFAVLKQLFDHRAATYTTVAAVALSLSSLRFDGWLEASIHDLYGYGLGFVMWFLAMVFLLASVGLKRLARARPDDDEELFIGRFLCSASIILFIVFGGWGIKKVLDDRLYGSAKENQFMSSHSVFFKRRPVCEVDIRAPSYQLELNAPIEIVQPDDYSFHSPRRLLSWGLPVVRYGEFDYFYVPGSQGKMLSARRKSGDPAGVLYISTSAPYSIKAKTMSIKLVDYRTKRTIFDQTWTEEIKRTGVMCPRYYLHAEGDSPPKKLITDALSGLVHAEEERYIHTYQKIPADAITPSATLEIPDLIRYDNRNCPEGVGFVGAGYGGERVQADPVFQRMGRAYAIGNSLYFPKGFWNSSCIADAIVLHSVERDDDNLNVHIHIRNQLSFVLQHDVHLVLEGLGTLVRDRQPYLAITDVTDKDLTLTVADRASGQSYRVKVTIPDPGKARPAPSRASQPLTNLSRQDK